MIVVAVLRVEELEDFDLVKRLVEEVLVVFDYFHAHIASVCEVNALYCLAEGCSAEKLYNLIPV
jgi:hypothetical protein